MIPFQIDKTGKKVSMDEHLGEGSKMLSEEDDDEDVGFDDENNEDEEIDEMVYGEDESNSDDELVQTWSLLKFFLYRIRYINTLELGISMVFTIVS